MESWGLESSFPDFSVLLSLLQVIFDLSHELLCAEYQVTEKPNTFPWMKKEVGSLCSRHLCRRADVSDVKVCSGNKKYRNKSGKSRDCNGKKKCEIWDDYGNVNEVMGEETVLP